MTSKKDPLTWSRLISCTKSGCQDTDLGQSGARGHNMTSTVHKCDLAWFGTWDVVGCHIEYTLHHIYIVKDMSISVFFPYTIFFNIFLGRGLEGHGLRSRQNEALGPQLWRWDSKAAELVEVVDYAKCLTRWQPEAVNREVYFFQETSDWSLNKTIILRNLMEWF